METPPAVGLEKYLTVWLMLPASSYLLHYIAVAAIICAFSGAHLSKSSNVFFFSFVGNILWNSILIWHGMAALTIAIVVNVQKNQNGKFACLHVSPSTVVSQVHRH
jgi:hypothetical protein